jgi:uncharacterized protein YkwD
MYTYRRLGMMAFGLALAIGPTSPVRAQDIDKPAAEMEKPKPPLSDEEVVERLRKVVELHNRERAREDLPPLEVEPRLVKAARRHALDMAKRNKMSHEGGDKSMPLVRIKGAGYRYQAAGENIARGWPNPEDTMKAWMKSPPHKKNVLGKYSQIGVALAFGEDGMFYWCVTFGHPKDS